MQQLTKKLSFLTALLSISLLAVLIATNFFGVYILGDTVTYMQFGSLGGPLTTFIQHDGLWPPLFALLFNIVNRLPLDTFTTASLWVSGVLVVFILLVLSVLKQVGISKKTSIALAALCITGPVTILMQSMISEPLMLVLWLASLYATIKFWKTSKEKWLIVWLVVAALLPLSRWLGALVTLWFSGIIFLKLAFDLRAQKKPTYSPWLLLLVLAVVWLPLGLYLFRTKVLIGSFFPPRDAQLTSLVEIAGTYGSELLAGVSLSSLATFLYSMGVRTKQHRSTLWFILAATLGSTAIYLAGLLFSESKYLVAPHIPSRFVSPSFPFVILSVLLIGLLLQTQLHKYLGEKMLKYIQTLGVLVGIVLILSSAGRTIIQLQDERLSYEPLYTYVGWTGDLAQFCTETPTYVIYHVHTRNWGAHSYDYFCDIATTITTSGSVTVEQGATIITPYKIEDQHVAVTNSFVLNDYTTYIYTATESATVDVEKLFAERGVFE